MVGIALAPLIILTLKNIMFTPVYTAHVLDTGWVQFLQPLAPGLIAQGALTGICALLVQLDVVQAWSQLVGWSVALSVLYAGICALFVLTASDRTMLREALSPAKGSSPL